MIKKYKISFCTVCMDRLGHLKQTLPQNIRDNLSYGNIEFVVLNYNSKDNLDEWITTKMSHYINRGVLKYIKTTDPQHFLRSHSKNAVVKEACGEIVCNVDADNFLGEGFADFINKSYQKNFNSYLAVDDMSINQSDCFGRICCRKDDFIKLRGYDEGMLGYGFEDIDLRNRLKMLGRKERFILNPKFLKYIGHSDKERQKNEDYNNGIKCIYMKYITPSISEVVYCFTNTKAYIGNILDNRSINAKSRNNLFAKNRNCKYQYTLIDDHWLIGKYVSSDIILLDSSQIDIKSSSDYFEVPKIFYNHMAMFFAQISNRIIMNQNLSQKRISVNHESFGEITLE